MFKQKRARDYGVRTGRLKPGKLNSINDVEGVLVGHVTLDDHECKTIVTQSHGTPSRKLSIRKFIA